MVQEKKLLPRFAVFHDFDRLSHYFESSLSDDVQVGTLPPVRVSLGLPATLPGCTWLGERR